MSTLAASAGPEAGSRPTTRAAGAGLVAGLRLSDPIAPLAWLVVPLPLWWVLGLANLGYFLVAVPMALALVRVRGLRVPPGFGWWLAFLLWLVLSIAMLGLNPAGTIAQSGGSRLIPVGFRLAEYGSATVMLLWALNVDPVRVPAQRLARMLALLMVWTVAGGMLGAVAPTFQIHSLMESLLPGNLLSNGYVMALVHPAAAQIQDVISTGNGRPSAPFPYTNSWGNALGLLIPWGIAAAVLARTRAGRWWWGGLAVASLVPAVLSLNRGLWIGLVIGFAFVVLRFFLTGRVMTAVLAVGLSVAALGVLLLSPLGDVAEQRNSGDAPSNDIRGYSIERAIEITRESPVLGFGGTRAQVGSQDTIAVGKSATCQNCGNLPLGTNGQLWFAIVGQGFVGAFFYLMFHLSLLRRFLRKVPGRVAGTVPTRESVIVTAGAAAMLLSVWFCFVYDRTGPTGCIEFLGIAVAVKHLLFSRSDPAGVPA